MHLRHWSNVFHESVMPIYERTQNNVYNTLDRYILRMLGHLLVSVNICLQTLMSWSDSFIGEIVDVLQFRSEITLKLKSLKQTKEYYILSYFP